MGKYIKVETKLEKKARKELSKSIKESTYLCLSCKSDLRTNSNKCGTLCSSNEFLTWRFECKCGRTNELQIYKNHLLSKK